MKKLMFTFIFSIFVFLTMGYTQEITLTKSFSGVPWNGKLPPDPGIAVGPNNVVLTINNEIEIYDKNGTELSASTLLNWFSSVSPPAEPFDPKIVYDHFDNRWIIFTLSETSPGATPSNYLISVSQTSDPTGGWYFYKFDASMDNNNSTYNFADFTGLGYDQQAIYITSNQKYDYAQQDFQYAKIRAIKKSDLYSNVPNPAFHDFTGMTNADGSLVENIKPTHQFGTSSAYYLVNSANEITANYVTVWAITNPFGSNPTIIKHEINVGSYDPPGSSQSQGDAVQKNSTTKINLNDARISDCIYRDGFLYGSFAVKNSTSDGSGIKYFKINTSDFSLSYNNIIQKSGIWYYYPEIYPDNYGNVLICFSESSSNDYVGFAYTYRKAGQSTIGPISWLKQGEGAYVNLNNNINRWGDYNGIAFDPSQSNQIWFYGEYAKPDNTWGTWVGAVQFSLSNVSVTFTNRTTSQPNLGGSFNISGVGPTNSGVSFPLQQGNYTASTNDERFSNWNSNGVTYKQNNWNTDNTEYFLSHDFTATFGPEQNQNAYFNSLNYAKVEVLVDNTLVTNQGSMDFQDPWYVQSNGSQQGTNYWIPVTSYYEPTGNVNASDKGVFLSQPIVSGNPYYSVRAPLTQTISINGNNYTGVFQSWDTSGATLQQVGSNPSGYDQKAVVFNQPNATVTAEYKGVHLSNDASAFSNNSQRRLIETQSGGKTWLHMVYTSLGHVWIEHSSDGGKTWILGNNGQPLDGTAGGKNPSIAYTTNSPNYNFIGVVWQQPYNSTYQIWGQVFNQSISTSMIPEDWSLTHKPESIYTEPSDPYSVNANPNLVLTGNVGGPYFITIERKSASGSWQPGINWLIGHIGARSNGDGSFGLYQQNGIISGTNAGTTNTQISKDPAESGPSVIAVDVIRQQGSPGTIYGHYLYIYQNSGTYWYYYQYDDGMISYNAPVNFSPSIVNINNGHYAACWIEYSDMTYNYDGGPVRYYFGSNGSNAQSCSINRGGYNSSGSAFAAWSQHGTSWSNKSIRISSGTPVTSSISALSTSGEYIQVGNGPGSDLSNMYAESFYPFSSPYYFKTTSNPLSKSNSVVAEGRGFVINKGDASFSYRFGELKVDGNYIGFVDVPDTSDFGNIGVLNNALVTKPFKINADSKIYFSVRSGFADSAAAVKVLGKNGFIHYKIELIDNSTGDVLGTIKDVKINSSNVHSLKEPLYSLSAKGLSGNTVKAKIIVKTNLSSTKNSLDESSIRFLQNDKIPAAIRNARKKDRHSNIILTKSFTDVSSALTSPQVNAAEQLTLQGTDVPKTYALAQNYPNPFNPSTTIHYEIPNNGIVTLKVYDILGKEVKTLVNQYQNKGRYDVNFNAKDLASGVYIYRLQSGNFVSTKKMLLLK